MGTTRVTDHRRRRSPESKRSATSLVASREHSVIRWARWVGAALFTIWVIFAVYYSWEINPSMEALIIDTGPYSALTDAFVSGHAYLRQQPSPELLHLP